MTLPEIVEKFHCAHIIYFYNEEPWTLDELEDDVTRLTDYDVKSVTVVDDLAIVHIV